ncbi:MAG: ArsR/SmtB family transcription factor, partial [Candidatus Aenigmatarchaeota archaeon]
MTGIKLIVMVFFIREGKDPEKIDAESLNEAKLKAIDDPTRLEILNLVQRKPSYPSRIASELNISKQQAYYHVEKLKDVGLIEKVKEEKKSGGLATFYRPVAGGFIVDLGGEGEKLLLPSRNEEAQKFLSP